MKNCGPDDEPRCETSEPGERLIGKSDIVRASLAVSRRIMDIFNYQSVSKIVFQLKIDAREVHSVVEGDRLPSAEMLLAIQKITGASIDWLLTGAGNKLLPLARPLIADNVRQGPWGPNNSQGVIGSAYY